MPRPKSNEEKQEFISRCVDDSEMLEDFPDQKERAGRCYGYWESYGKGENEE